LRTGPRGKSLRNLKINQRPTTSERGCPGGVRKENQRGPTSNFAKKRGCQGTGAHGHQAKKKAWATLTEPTNLCVNKAAKKKKLQPETALLLEGGGGGLVPKEGEQQKENRNGTGRRS